MTTPEVKPITNLTKKGYSQICDYILGNAEPEHAKVVIDLMTEAMNKTIGFDPNARVSRELSLQKYEQKKARGVKNDPDHYNKYGKKSYAKKKALFPNIPASVVAKNSIEDLVELSALNYVK